LPVGLNTLAPVALRDLGSDEDVGAREKMPDASEEEHIITASALTVRC